MGLESRISSPYMELGACLTAGKRKRPKRMSHRCSIVPKEDFKNQPSVLEDGGQENTMYNKMEYNQNEGHRLQRKKCSVKYRRGIHLATKILIFP
jgi:hypothetical protein